MRLVIQLLKEGKIILDQHLYVVGRKVGAVTDYKYSKALSNYDKEWTFEGVKWLFN